MLITVNMYALVLCESRRAVRTISFGAYQAVIRRVARR